MCNVFRDNPKSKELMCYAKKELKRLDYYTSVHFTLSKLCNSKSGDHTSCIVTLDGIINSLLILYCTKHKIQWVLHGKPNNFQNQRA